MEVLYLDGSHAWIICDECNQWKLLTGTVSDVIFIMVVISEVSCGARNDKSSEVVV